MILYGIGLLTTYFYMSGCGIITNITKKASLGGAAGAAYSHEATDSTNKYRTGNRDKRDEAIVGAMVGAAAVKARGINNGINGSLLIGTASAIGAGAFSSQLGKDKFKKPALVIGVASTIADFIRIQIPAISIE